MNDAEKTTIMGGGDNHPFLIENMYRMVAEQTTGGDLSNPENVLKPLIDVYTRQREAYFAAAREEASGEYREILDYEYQQPWWRLLPMTLPTGQSHHEISMVYATYRLMTNGNMTFLVAKQLGDALFNTDFAVRMEDLHFPADTFTVYYRDSSIPIGPSYLKWIFVDRVTLGAAHTQLRLLFGFIDEDGDYANSDFFLYDYSDSEFVKSDELFQQLDDKEISELSGRRITDQNRRDTRNMLTALFNFLLYVGTAGDQQTVRPPDHLKRLEQLQNPKKKRRLRKAIVNETLFRYTYIGGNYETKVESGGGDGAALEHKVLVRGHWRHQWTGRQRDAEGNRIPGTSQKLIWIEPYWKGPEGTDTKTTVRVVR